MNNEIINDTENSEENNKNIFIKNISATQAISMNSVNNCKDSDFDINSINSIKSDNNKETNNGWDNPNATDTLKSWYELFSCHSYIYQFILDRNRKISDRLNIISVISSSSLGIFSAFKLWIANDNVFQVASNILLMFLNFIIAILTAMSKRYIDDKRNEEIRIYIQEVDHFVGILGAQYFKANCYRMNADDFFSEYNSEYTELICKAPNLSIYEMEISNQKYLIYLQEKEKHEIKLNNIKIKPINQEIQTEDNV